MLTVAVAFAVDKNYTVLCGGFLKQLNSVVFLRKCWKRNQPALIGIVFIIKSDFNSQPKYYNFVNSNAEVTIGLEMIEITVSTSVKTNREIQNLET